MRRTSAAAAVLLALLTACGGGSGDDGGTAGDGSPGGAASVAAISEQELEGRLLTAEDLGTEWEKGEAEEESETPEPTPTGSPGECDFERQFGDPAAEAEAEFQTRNGSFLIQSLAAFQPGTADGVYDDVEALFDRCTDLLAEEEGLEFEIAPFDGAPDVGDESLSRSISATVGGVTVRGAMTVFRSGDVLCFVVGIARDFTPETFFVPGVRKAADRLA